MEDLQQDLQPKIQTLHMRLEMICRETDHEAEPDNADMTKQWHVSQYIRVYELDSWSYSVARWSEDTLELGKSAMRLSPERGELWHLCTKAWGIAML